MFETATGFIDVWEKKILSSQDQERMLKAPNREDGFLVLFDTDLGELAEKTEKDIEALLEKDLSALRGKMSLLLGEKENYFWFFFLKYDCLNLKLVLKKQIGEFSFEPFAYSIEPYEKLEQRISQPLSVRLMPCVENIIVQAQKSLAGKKITSAIIEEAVDRAYFQEKLAIANKNDLLLGLVKTEIDIANIKAAFSSNGFLEGGNLQEQDIINLAAKKQIQGPESLEKFLETLRLSFIVKEKQTMVNFEKKLKAYISENIFKKERETSQGLEKIVAFWEKKMNAQSNIRLIMLSKENNWTTEETTTQLLPIQ